jgi:hypothetical protein
VYEVSENGVYTGDDETTIGKWAVLASPISWVFWRRKNTLHKRTAGWTTVALCKLPGVMAEDVD